MVHGLIRIKGDERILGNSDFVEAVLREADEQLDLLTKMNILELEFNIIHVKLKV